MSLRSRSDDAWVSPRYTPGTDPPKVIENERSVAGWCRSGGAARSRARTPAAKAASKNRGSSSGPRPMWARGSAAQASRQPSASTSTRGSSQAGGSTPAGQATVGRRQREDGARVVGDAAMALARVGLRHADGENRLPAERLGGVRDLRQPGRAVAERGAGADDARARRPRSPRPRRAHARPAAPRRRSRTAGPRRSTARRRSTPPRDRATAARARCPRATPAGRHPPTWTYATWSPASAAATGATWLCSVQQTTGMPSSRSASSPSSSANRVAACTGVYGSVMTWAPGSGVEPRPRVRFAYRTSKPPEPSPSSRACVLTSTSSPSATGPVRRGYAMQGSPSTSRRTRPGSALADGGDPAAPQADGHYAARAASTSASVTSTIASRSATAMCSSDEWMFAIPLPRFTHCRPRSLKTLASAPPPVRM